MARQDVNQDQTNAYPVSEFQNLQYRSAAGAWINVPGIEGSSLDGTAAASREIKSASTATQQRIGRTSVGQITFEANAIPQDAAWRYLRTAYKNGTLVQFRYDTNPEVYFTADASNGAEVDISTSGACTFTGGSNQAAPTVAGDYGLGRGAVIHGSDKDYIITAITTGGAITVAQLPNYTTTGMDALADVTPFTIYNPPGLRYSFRAYVSQGADFSLSAESHMTTTLILIPRKELVEPTIITE